MEKKQLRNILLIVLLPVLFAGIGYFGMKVFLSGTGPNTVMPERATQESMPQDETAQVGGGDTDIPEKTKEGTDSKIAEEASASTHQSTSNNEADNSEPTMGVSEPEESKTQTEPSEDTRAVEVVDPVQGEQYAFDSLNYFSLQVGSYSAASNAENHVSQLREEGISAYIFYGNNYKVMVGLSASREGVEQIKKQIVESVPDAFVKGMMIVPDTLSYKAEANNLEQFKAIARAYYERLEHHVAFLSAIEGLTGDQIMTEIESERGSIAELQAQIDQFDGDHTFEDVLDKIKINLMQTDQSLGQIINNEFVQDSVFKIYTDEFLKYNELTR